jgi:hypothetical protein
MTEEVPVETNVPSSPPEPQPPIKTEERSEPVREIHLANLSAGRLIQL